MLLEVALASDADVGLAVERRLGVGVHGDGDRDVERLAIAEHLERDHLARRGGLDDVAEIEARTTVDAHQHIAGQDAGLGGRTRWNQFGDERVVGLLTPVPAVPLNSTLEAAMIPSAEKVSVVLGELLGY